MTDDNLHELRIVDEPLRPRERFVASLRAGLEAALGTAPPIDTDDLGLPETGPDAGASAQIVPYLCASPAVEAIAWYADVFGAVETLRYTGDDGRIGHAELDLAGAKVMLADEHPEIGVLSPGSLGGTAVSLHVTLADVDAVHARAITAGAKVERPPHDEAYGARSMTLLDPFGHRWMVQTPIADPSLAEIESRIEGYTITAGDDPPDVQSP